MSLASPDWPEVALKVLDPVLVSRPDLGRQIGPALGDDPAAPPEKAVVPPEEAAAPDAQGG